MITAEKPLARPSDYASFDRLYCASLATHQYKRRGRRGAPPAQSPATVTQHVMNSATR